MTLLHDAGWLIVPVLILGFIAYNVLNQRKRRRLQRQIWEASAAQVGGTLTANGRDLRVEVPLDTGTLTADTFSVTQSTGGEGATSHTEHFTRFQIPCIPKAPLRFILVERTPSETLSKSILQMLNKDPKNELPLIALDDPSFDRIFRLRADPPEAIQALLHGPLAQQISALRYVIWQYDVPEPRGAVAKILTTDVKKIGRKGSTSATDPPEQTWWLSALIRGQITNEDEFEEIVTTLTAIYDRMRRLGIVADPARSKSPE